MDIQQLIRSIQYRLSLEEDTVEQMNTKWTHFWEATCSITFYHQPNIRQMKLNAFLDMIRHYKKMTKEETEFVVQQFDVHVVTIESPSEIAIYIS
jgi:hypothetical protein